ncbi:MAG TPA: pilin [Candidatus Saccharimonadales bacterium]|nr:pilin [Candidatus Saccharimonadales bacterium]
MMQKIRNWSAALLFVATLGGATMTVALPQTTVAACSDRLLTFPAWYKGIQNADCTIKNPNDSGGISKFIWTIVLNVIELMLQLVGYIAVVFIIIGGFKFLTGTGTPDTVAKARTTILNAIIGLVISIFSVAIVNVVAGTLK